MYDSIIIGSGPAGISASLYMIRAGLKILIISKNETALNKAEHIENYYGFENGISGKELNDIGIKQAQNLGVEILEKEVISIKYADEGYEVVVANQGMDEKYLADGKTEEILSNQKLLEENGLELPLGMQRR